MDREQAQKYFEYALSGIEAEYQDKIKAHKEWRDRELENAREFWLPMLEDSEARDDAAGEVVGNGSQAQKPRRQRRVRLTGSRGQTVPSEVIKMFVHRVLGDLSVEDVTQTVVKDRILVEYPDAKVPSIRSAIAHELLALKNDGYLELVEEGRAGQPNRYHRTEQLLSVIENREMSLMEP